MYELLAKTFKDRRVLVTGHTGFKGPWLLAMLDMLGADVTGFALAPETDPSGYRLIGGDQLCRSVIGDLRDRDSIRRAVDGCRPEFVIHMGAQSLVRRSYRDPTETFDSNISGTINVLEAMRQYDGACSVLIVTTDKVYAESGTGAPYVESDQIGGHDPYSTSKAACELVTESYRASYFQPDRHAQHGKCVATARAGNVIGGGDWCEDRLIPDVVRAMSAGEPVRVRNPEAVRPWQHVLEPLSGYLLLAAHQAREPRAFAESFNFGPNAQDTLQVEDVVKLAIQAWGTGRYFCDIDPHAPHEAALLRLNSDKSAKRLDWRPQWNATTAITKTIEWYRHAPTSSISPLRYSQGQIRDYFKLGQC